MSTATKKAYVYKMKLVPANILGTVILVLLILFSILIKADFHISGNFWILLITLILYLCLHEFLHGIGYLIGGTKRKNIAYGICLEKGILYCMAYQELTKKNILISLQMPFVVIGVITYIISYIFNLPYLMFLSIVNLVGACMDLVMFIYISKLDKDVIYSESGEPDQFVLISSEDLTKKKSKYFEIVDVKDYKKEDYRFKDIKKITISKTSYIVLGVLLLGVILSII
ncbi:MAG: DUF3267 domain-containing protein [Bacilli bacterium]|nr:DUF3267 domain-containing protein [Bacilli bacterium]